MLIWAAELFIILRPTSVLKPDESEINVAELEDTDYLLEVIAKLIPHEIREKELTQVEILKEEIAKYTAMLLDDVNLTGDKLV